MKKILMFLTAAMIAVGGVNAQEETPLALGGGWNNGFAGDADVYDYTIRGKWVAPVFTCNVLSAEYPKYIVELEKPLASNFQINYEWKESADATGKAEAAYGRAVGDGTTTKFELYFDSNHPYITSVTVQHTDEVEASLKIKKLILVSASGDQKIVAPVLASWADGTENTLYYKGKVSYNAQWQQLEFKDVAGKSDLTIRVELAENAENVQMCVAYEDKTAEYPQFNGGKEVTFTTKKDVNVKTIGVQFTKENAEASVTVNSAICGITKPTSSALAKVGSSTYWGTYSNNLANVELSGDGVEVYNVTIEGKKLKFTRRGDNKVAKGEGVIVKCKGESFNVKVITEEVTAAAASENLLKATPTTVQSIESTEATLYYLTKNTAGKLGFYWRADDGKSLPNAQPGKAYLAIPNTYHLSKTRSIDIDDPETTDIEGVKAERVQHDAIYNLAGQRVGKLSKGINIVGNKKVLVK